MAGKCRAISMAPMMAIVVVAVLTVAAVTGVVAQGSLGNPTSLTTWSAADCSGDSSTIDACGCTDLVYYVGQEFHYGGKGAALYTETGCGGTPAVVFEDYQDCGVSDLGWRSMHIFC